MIYDRASVSWGQYVSKYERTVSIAYYSNAKPDQLVKYVTKKFNMKQYLDPQPSTNILQSCPYLSGGGGSGGSGG